MSYTLYFIVHLGKVLPGYTIPDTCTVQDLYTKTNCNFSSFLSVKTLYIFGINITIIKLVHDENNIQFDTNEYINKQRQNAG